MKATEIGKVLGKQWRELPEYEKKVCHPWFHYSKRIFVQLITLPQKYKDAAAANLSRYREIAGTTSKGDATVEVKAGAAS
jgi:hypothetical protein